MQLTGAFPLVSVSAVAAHFKLLAAAVRAFPAFDLDIAAFIA